MFKNSISAAIFLLFFTAACLETEEKEGWREGNPLLKSCVYLNSKYHRSFEKNTYELLYQPSPPSHIVIRVRYKPKSDVPHIMKVAAEAEKNAKRVVLEKYKFNITTSVDIAPL